jgi:hypothetical protein
MSCRRRPVRPHLDLLAALELDNGVGEGLVEAAGLDELLELLLDGRVEVVKGSRVAVMSEKGQLGKRSRAPIGCCRAAPGPS